MSKKNQLTKLVDNPTVTAIFNSGLSALPFGGLVASIMGTDAAGRQMDMVHRAAIRMQTDLQNHINSQKRITNEQLKMIQEVTLAVRESSSEAKTEYLINAFRNTLENGSTLGDYQAIQLGRFIRDISADEIAFLIEAKSEKYSEGIRNAGPTEPTNNGFLLVRDPEAKLIFMSLIRLGLLEESRPNSIGGSPYALNSWAIHLLDLLMPKAWEKSSDIDS
ncbi:MULTISPECIES: hypothetical protein [Pseudomonas]|uniref:Uncharacterized protein n=2 Tax=Pseudomonas TaxID=286 RepID=A0A2X2CYG3_PSELU|nr:MULTISPECIES: hypothetical protein [Pseudomonas]SER22843.1 hypothetical protein SAMN05216409_11495 [Pseudomonas lutea]SPZ04975.1 Uncharacterised protein [Pseudomonas luteola]